MQRAIGIVFGADVSRELQRRDRRWCVGTAREDDHNLQIDLIRKFDLPMFVAFLASRLNLARKEKLWKKRQSRCCWIDGSHSHPLLTADPMHVHAGQAAKAE